jgi:glycosyltransferase involved in cell wall biosynthesis
MSLKLSVIIPAYNEEKTIQTILQKVNDVQLIGSVIKEIIVVNDCSKITQKKRFWNIKTTTLT